MHQFTTPSLSQTIWPRWASRQFLSLPTEQTLLAVTFGYSLSSEAVVMRQLRRWKRMWRRSLTRSHKRTSMEPSSICWNGTSAFLLEENTSKVTRVLSIKVPIRKMSGNLFNDPRSLPLSKTKQQMILPRCINGSYKAWIQIIWVLKVNLHQAVPKLKLPPSI